MKTITKIKNGKKCTITYSSVYDEYHLKFWDKGNSGNLTDGDYFTDDFEDAKTTMNFWLEKES